MFPGIDAPAGIPDAVDQPGKSRLVVAQPDHELHLAPGRKAHGVVRQVAQDPADGPGVAVDRLRQVRPGPDHQAQALLPGPGQHVVGSLPEQFGGVEGGPGQLHLAGIHPGDVQDFVDQPRQGVARVGDGRHALPLFQGQGGLGQHLAHAHDAV